MNTNELKVEVRRLESGVGVIDVQGVMTSSAEERLMNAYNQAISEQQPGVIFNFSELEYINSSGIGLLITILIRAKRQGHKLIACGLKDHFKQIFKLTRLDEAMPIFDSQDEALAALTKESTLLSS